MNIYNQEKFNYENLKEKKTYYIFDIDGGETGVPKFFLQVGDWFYPLVPDVSPCYRSEYGAFILPDLHSSIEGNITCNVCHSIIFCIKFK